MLKISMGGALALVLLVVVVNECRMSDALMSDEVYGGGLEAEEAQGEVASWFRVAARCLAIPPPTSTPQPWFRVAARCLVITPPTSTPQPTSGFGVGWTRSWGVMMSDAAGGLNRMRYISRLRMFDTPNCSQSLLVRSEIVSTLCPTFHNCS